MNSDLESAYRMMRKSCYILILITFFGCNSENGSDCFQAAGSIIETTFPVSGFTKIRIEGEVSLILRQGAIEEVTVETGENLLNDVSVSVQGETLVIRDGNSCNLVRDYGITKAVVTSPNITELRNSSSYDIRSDGVLNFSDLFLISDTSGGIENVRKGGDFYLRLNCINLGVRANGQSVFYLSGEATNTFIQFTDEAPRFEGAELRINNLSVLQRSANKMIVNPLDKISGEIRGTGDIISVNEPPIVAVEQFFTGQLIFQD